MSFESARLRLAILGTRGVPARYGGFETFAEQLATRLAARGHEVRIYGRTRYAGEPPPEPLRVVTLPAVYTKHLETVTHGVLAALHLASRPVDAALVCNAVHAPLLPLLRAAGVPAALNVDGLEWRRRKWGAMARGVHRLAEHLAVACADAVVTDARTVQAYYRERHQAETTFIPYGGDLPPEPAGETLSSLALRPGGYDLCVCRFEPENHPLLVVETRHRLAFRRPLVLVGGAPYARAYESRLRARAGGSVLLAGFRFGAAYRELLFHARAAVVATEAGGTHPVLLEAMGAGLPVLYSDTPENREAAGDTGLPFPVGDAAALAAAWQRLEDEPGLARDLGRRAAERIDACYRWERVTDAYEALLRGLALRESRARPRESAAWRPSP